MINFSFDFNSTSINEFLIRKGSTIAPPGVNNLYIGNNNIASLHYFDANGVEIPLTALYQGANLVWQN